MVPVHDLSRVIITRQWWQALVLGNQVDIRGCLAQRKDPTQQVTRHGVITIYGSSVDGVVENNTQYDSDGILLNVRYFLPTPPWPVDHVLQYFTDVRGNVIDGESDWTYSCSRGGIDMWHQGTETGAGLPMLPAFGVQIAGNTIHHSDGSNGGAISTDGQVGSEEDVRPYWESTLIYGNAISDIQDPPPDGDLSLNCGTAHARIGIHLVDRHIAHTVLRANALTNVAHDRVDNGTGTIDLP